ncbi:glycosyltransferase [Aquabacter sp. CN5-332]|uniref:glycosyltransferase family 2 protein n=1 Tax=Aquabacter sp. CN5-332 TaxID=3156608 RepID=UPI0032B5D5CC
MPSLAVCIACFNRRDQTLACLERLFAQRRPADMRLVVHLLDDASTDGTGAAVARAFPDVIIHQGDGHRYWAGGMRIVYGAALAEGHDFYLWMNDDALLLDDALWRAFSTLEHLQRTHGGAHVVVGAMRDQDGATTYGGLARGSGLKPWRLRRIEPWPDAPRECDTLHGNFVLVPAAVALKVGNIPRAYRHSLADLDFGFSSRHAGFRIWVAPGHLGVTLANVVRRRGWLDPGLTLGGRLRSIEHPLGHPFWPSLFYNFRNFGPSGLLPVLSPYVRLLAAHLRSTWATGRGTARKAPPSSGLAGDPAPPLESVTLGADREG